MIVRVNTMPEVVCGAADETNVIIRYSNTDTARCPFLTSSHSHLHPKVRLIARASSPRRPEHGRSTLGVNLVRWQAVEIVGDACCLVKHERLRKAAICRLTVSRSEFVAMMKKYAYV